MVTFCQICCEIVQFCVLKNKQKDVQSFVAQTLRRMVAPFRRSVKSLPWSQAVQGLNIFYYQVQVRRWGSGQSQGVLRGSHGVHRMY